MVFTTPPTLLTPPTQYSYNLQIQKKQSQRHTVNPKLGRTPQTKHRVQYKNRKYSKFTPSTILQSIVIFKLIHTCIYITDPNNLHQQTECRFTPFYHMTITPKSAV
jgi:hypothetical protein